MVADQFGAILQELSQAMQIDELHSDRNNSCKIKLQSGVEIQLEIDRSGNFLIVGTDLGEVPPGKYRENIFREALKANDLPPPLNGILSYSKATNHMVLFQKVHVKDLNGEKVAGLIPPFLEKAKAWSEALVRGEIPSITQVYSSDRRSSGMFGLR